ncbi:MAG: TerC family protein, partial [Planctomycetes bacterium]|nr:TerC family protein [Planctomycetota bacterium]
MAGSGIWPRHSGPNRPVPPPAPERCILLETLFPYWHWFAFGALVVFLLTLDLFVFHRHDHTPSLRESTGWSAFWISLGVAFSGVIWWLNGPTHGPEAATQYLTGFLIEKSLSMDNIFVFVVIFRFFQVPMMYQYHVLFWGILGAIVMRLIFILLGVGLVTKFAWVIPVFGVFLVYTAVKLAMHSGTDVHPENNFVLKTARRFFHVTKGDHREHGHAFFVKENGLWCITPMFLVLLVIESSDVMFAVDSVPAIIAISRDPFIIFTSNIFAILGLRALYFLLAGVVDKFRYLHYGLAAVLGFVGLKMIADYSAERFFGHPEGVHLIPTWVSLVVVAGLLAISIIASVIASRYFD